MALTPTSYLVLGCLASNGPATPYELKQQVNEGVGYFWAFPHSQLYSEPPRLAEAGLVAERRERTGRRRRIFSITAEGRAALQVWLADPASELPEIRDTGLLKLFFGGLATTTQLQALAETQRDAHRERLRLYESLDVVGAQGPAAATLGLGLAWERAATAFWESLAANPPS